jgi:hypothetical protein
MENLLHGTTTQFHEQKQNLKAPCSPSSIPSLLHRGQRVRNNLRSIRQPIAKASKEQELLPFLELDSDAPGICRMNGKSWLALAPR